MWCLRRLFPLGPEGNCHFFVVFSSLLGLGLIPKGNRFCCFNRIVQHNLSFPPWELHDGGKNIFTPGLKLLYYLFKTVVGELFRSRTPCGSSTTGEGVSCEPGSTGSTTVHQYVNAVFLSASMVHAVIFTHGEHRTTCIPSIGFFFNALNRLI